MLLNKLTGWYHPIKPVSASGREIASHEVVFTLTFHNGHLEVFADGTHKYFQPGIEYNLTGWRRGDNGPEVMLTDSRVMVLPDLSTLEVRCTVQSNSWAGAHTEEFDINARNRRERRKALKAGQRAYPFFTDVQREASPVFYVPTRPARNQPNGVLGVDARVAAMHADLHRPTQQELDGKKDTVSGKSSLADDRPRPTLPRPNSSTYANR